MKIGLLSPSIYMSQERFPDMIFAPRDLSVALVDGLVQAGHQVFFFTAPGIKTQARLIAGDETLLRHDFSEEKMRNAEKERLKWASFYMLKRNYEIDLTTRCYQMAKEGKIDIIHSYHDIMAHFFNELTGFPTVYTLHDPLPKDPLTFSYWLLQKFHHHNYISISNAFRQHSNLQLNFAATVYHGIDIADKKTTSFFRDGSYMAYIGRIVPEKGLADALDLALATQVPLHIATSLPTDYQKTDSYQKVLAPKLSRAGKLVNFTGFMKGAQKAEFLGNARCLVFPIHWEEPFGMVMIEAMACGTPVVAYNRGSVSEIVKDGVTGFIIEPVVSNLSRLSNLKIQKRGIAGLVEAIKRIGEIDRTACRRHIEENFTVEKMVQGYERVYQKVINSKLEARNSKNI